MVEDSFFHYWFKGFEEGLDRLDEKSRDTLLQACGKACAASYTMGVFREARAGSRDMESFLQNLQERFPNSIYTKLDEKRISVVYEKCACDLVGKGLVKTPVLCRCSVYNLKENFTEGLGRTVSVEMESSILGGGDKCSFIVTID